MFGQIFNIFLDVVTPVYLLVLFGYLTGPQLKLDPRTLSRTAYFIFVPSFVFNTISTANIEFSTAFRMILFSVVTHILLAILAFSVAKSLRRSKEMIAAYVMIAVFGNVGNFGLSLTIFRYGEVAKVPTTVYFVAIMLLAFIISVGIASWTQGGKADAVLSVLKTPAVIAVIPAGLFAATETPVPLFLSRTTGLLGAAMVPTMLFTLGVQLASSNKLSFSLDSVLSNSVRLIGGPILATSLVIPFGLTGIERGTGILQSSMPAAVLVSIIAIEYKTVPNFVTSAVLLSTLASLFTLTIVIYLT